MPTIGREKKLCVTGLHPCDCRKINIELYRAFFSRNGYTLVDSVDRADAIVLWTCGFRGDYRDNSRDMVQRLLETAPGKDIVAVGCLPDIDPNVLPGPSPLLTIVPWKSEEAVFSRIFDVSVPLSHLQRTFAERKLVDDLQSYRKARGGHDRTFSDQFIKLFVSEGCNLACTYCSEKRAFPPYRSYPLPELVAACRRTTEETGQRDVMLIGDNVGEYGLDQGVTLPLLMERLLDIHPDIRIGIQNLNPAYFVKYIAEMRALIQRRRLLHLRLPIQSASDRILRSMGRTYTKQDIEKAFATMLELKFNDYSTDLIVGFPGEEDADFQESIDFILAFLPRYVNLSRFMVSATIPAGGYPRQVEELVKTERIRRADALFSSKGIYCNTDSGATSANRRRIINSLLKGRKE